MLRNMVGPATQLTQFWVPNITATEERLMKAVQGALRFMTAGMAAEVAATRRQLCEKSDWEVSQCWRDLSRLIVRSETQLQLSQYSQ